MKIAALLRAPAAYGIWALVTLSALVASYFVDPHVFAFTTLGLGWLSGLVGLVGLAVVLLSKAMGRSAKVRVVVALALTAALLCGALAILGSFHWA